MVDSCESNDKKIYLARKSGDFQHPKKLLFFKHLLLIDSHQELKKNKKKTLKNEPFLAPRKLCFLGKVTLRDEEK